MFVFMLVLMYFAWMSFSLNLSLYGWNMLLSSWECWISLIHSKVTSLCINKVALNMLQIKKYSLGLKRKKNLLFAHITALIEIPKKFCKLQKKVVQTKLDQLCDVESCSSLLWCQITKTRDWKPQRDAHCCNQNFTSYQTYCTSLFSRIHM